MLDMMILHMLLTIIIIIMMVFGAITYAKGGPFTTTHATIVDRWDKTLPNNKMEFFLAFRTKEGDLVELKVSKSVYKYNTLGTHGCLKYKGSKFISFQ